MPVRDTSRGLGVGIEISHARAMAGSHTGGSSREILPLVDAPAPI